MKLVVEFDPVKFDAFLGTYTRDGAQPLKFFRDDRRLYVQAVVNGAFTEIVPVSEAKFVGLDFGNVTYEFSRKEEQSHDMSALIGNSLLYFNKETEGMKGSTDSGRRPAGVFGPPGV